MSFTRPILSDSMLLARWNTVVTTFVRNTPQVDPATLVALLTQTLCRLVLTIASPTLTRQAILTEFQTMIATTFDELARDPDVTLAPDPSTH